MSWDENMVAHRYADSDGVRLHYVEAGTGPLVVLLHGFPQFWFEWRNQIPALVQAGFRVIAPDMRGYNLSDQPKDVSAYSTEQLARDVEQLIRTCGEERAIVIGHDWGGAVAYLFAMWYPSMVERLIILNAPHPERMSKGLRNLDQLRKSWYMFYYQLPWIPEWSTARGDYDAIRRVFRHDLVHKDAMSSEEIERYVEAARRSRLHGPINYYRWSIRHGLRADNVLKRIDAPTLVIWGKRDRYLGEPVSKPLPEWVPNLRFEPIDDASHWVSEERPERVNELILEFVGKPRTTEREARPEFTGGSRGIA